MLLALSASQHEELPRSWKLTLAVGLSVLLIGSLFLVQQWIVIVALISIALGMVVASSGKLSLYAYLVACVGISFRPYAIKGTDPLDVLAGVVLAGTMMPWLVRYLFVERTPLSVDRLHHIFLLFIAWGLFIGIGGIVFWNNTANNWLREFLIYSPLVILPVLYVRFFEPGSKSEKGLWILTLILATGVMIVTILRFRQNVVKAVYAWEMGRAIVDPAAAIFLIFIALSLAMSLRRDERRWWLYPIMLIGIGVLALSNFRTLWVGCIATLPILFFVATKEERSRGYRFMATIMTIVIMIGVIAYFTSPAFKLYILMLGERFLSTGKASTDISLLNRFIETNILLDYIASSPIVGYGFGAQFRLFDSIKGFSYDSGFAHNGYVFTVFKVGIVGAVLLYAAYFGFIRKIYQLASSSLHTVMDRAIARAALGFILTTLVTNTSLNIFADRSSLVWVGLIWGFVVSRGLGQKKPEAPKVHSTLEV